MEGGSLFTNWQEVRVQEQSQGSVAAGAPRSLTVLLQDELADQAQVGGEFLGWMRPFQYHCKLPHLSQAAQVLLLAQLAYVHC